MTEPLTDTWHTRDLLVLRAAVRHIDATGEEARVHHLTQATGLDSEQVIRAARALDSAGIVSAVILDGGWGGPTQVEAIRRLSRQAYELSGAWPGPDSVADRLLATLQDVAEHGSDPVEKAKARKALDAMGSLGRDLLVSVAGAAAGVAMQ
ncbi:hypothetical protein [Aeromicrobium sp. CnD17-E]|uniref:hypothetical protein n=1 Tax=Aeromicrobium sp. CnD17-E TaxID=2954487 RepID=UPI00209778B2|nr:hypothetical protein [Aeromicrobium sp. CnD17-E]MCO7238694.1 hypothetical protein [Aeromicrobium sp. CnD17-E]